MPDRGRVAPSVGAPPDRGRRSPEFIARTVLLPERFRVDCAFGGGRIAREISRFHTIPLSPVRGRTIARRRVRSQYAVARMAKYLSCSGAAFGK